MLLTLAHVEAELGSVQVGIDMCDDALGLDEISDGVRGLIYSQLGLLWMRAGAGDRAIEAFGVSEPLIVGDLPALARLHLNRGNVFLQRGMSDVAAQDFDAAITFASQAGRVDLRGKAEGNLGYTRMLQGDMVNALQLLDRAGQTFDSPVLRAVGQQDRAEVLMACGMASEAAGSLRDAASAFGARKLRQSQAEAELVLARLLLAEEPAEAARVAARARHRFDRRGSEAWAARAESIEVISELITKRDPRVAVDKADSLTITLRGLGLARDAEQLHLQSIRGLLRANDVEAAHDRLRSFRPSRHSPLESRILVRELRADAASRRGRTSDAWTHLRAGLSELHEWQSSFGSLELQSSVVGHGRALALKGMSLAVEDGRPEVVFEWSERARALAGRVVPVRLPADPDAARDLAELRQLQAEISAAEATGGVPAQLRKQADELRGTVRQRAWYDKGSGLVTEPATLDSVQARLAEDELMVSILAVDGRLHALVVTMNRADVLDLGPLSVVRSLLDGMQADLDMAAAHLPPPIRDVVHAGLSQRLVELSTQLVAPWGRRIRGRRVVVIPSGALAGTPWTLLPDLAGLPVTVPRSASEWVATRDVSRELRSAGFVAGPRVDRAHEEVKRAAYAWESAVVLEGERVRTDRVRDLASEVDVLHVAAHGRHSADNPLFSGLELVDGPWFGYDVDQVRSVPSTVILSACELGRSTVRWGEETIGMTVAWLHAGARCVIASPASVDDDVACEVLAETHQLLAAGTQPADALALAMAGNGSGAAPFLCFGSGW